MIDLDELFKFPAIMVDPDKEEEKMRRTESFAMKEEEPMDLIYGEAEFPYYDFVGITDRWLPTQESMNKALEGEFDACMVIFANVGPFLVPWTKSKFKKELRKFVSELPKPEAKMNMKMYHINSKDLKEILGKTTESGEDDEGDINPDA